MVPGRKALWIKGAGGMTVEVKEAFHQIIKMAILFVGVGIFYIWIESQISKKWNNRINKLNAVKNKFVLNNILKL
tara:strand:+ start:208 stop:432 length:225 start_codon:yes stop_codon:yes gene_type:complete